MSGEIVMAALSGAVVASNAAVLWRLRNHSRTRLLRGATAISRHLGVNAKHAQHLHLQRQLPTFQIPGDGAMHATSSALDEWLELEATRTLRS